MGFETAEICLGRITRTYECRDGTWTDHTGFFLDAEGVIYRRHLDGCSGKCTEREVTNAQFLEETEEARGMKGCSVFLPGDL